MTSNCQYLQEHSLAPIGSLMHAHSAPVPWTHPFQTAGCGSGYWETPRMRAERYRGRLKLHRASPKRDKINVALETECFHDVVLTAKSMTPNELTLKWGSIGVTSAFHSKSPFKTAEGEQAAQTCAKV
jgi:hypothetical protein